MLTSLDILYLVIAFCILWVTVFFCWLLYHVVVILRRTEVFMDEADQKMKRIDDAIRGVKDRIEHSVSQLGVIGDAAKNITKYFFEKKKKKEESDEL